MAGNTQSFNAGSGANKQSVSAIDPDDVDILGVIEARLEKIRRDFPRIVEGLTLQHQDFWSHVTLDLPQSLQEQKERNGARLEYLSSINGDIEKMATAAPVIGEFEKDMRNSLEQVSQIIRDRVAKKRTEKVAAAASGLGSEIPAPQKAIFKKPSV